MGKQGIIFPSFLWDWTVMHLTWDLKFNRFNQIKHRCTRRGGGGAVAPLAFFKEPFSGKKKKKKKNHLKFGQNHLMFWQAMENIWASDLSPPKGNWSRTPMKSNLINPCEFSVRFKADLASPNAFRIICTLKPSVLCSLRSSATHQVSIHHVANISAWTTTLTTA